MTTLIWFIVAGGCLIAELFSGTFYLLIIGIAFGLAGVAGVFDTSLLVQLLIILIASVLGLVIVRNSRLKNKKNAQSAEKDLVLDIGQKVQVSDWQKEGESYIGMTKYRGASWQVCYHGEISPVSGSYQISGIDGNVLQVKKID